MWQNLIVLIIVAVAAGYVVWNIYRGIVGAAGSCSGGGCGGCGTKKAAGDGNLVQLTSEPNSTSPPTSADESSAVSSHRS